MFPDFFGESLDEKYSLFSQESWNEPFKYIRSQIIDDGQRQVHSDSIRLSAGIKIIAEF